MTGMRSAARGAAPPKARAPGFTALIAAAALSVTGCAQGAGDPSLASDSASAADVADSSDGAESGASSAESGAASSESEPDSGASSSPAAEDAESESEPEELLEEQEIAEILLTESELPFTPDRHSTFTGLDFFQEQLAVEEDIYAENFGDGACAAAMDRVNAELVGESPQGGVVQEYEHQLEDRTESLYVWMLGLEEPQDSAAVWDQVLDACAGTPLRGETDSVQVKPFEAQEFEGIELDMDVHNGEDMVEVLGYSASVDYGRHLLMVSAANMEAETFSTIVELQAEKLAAYRYENAD
ncbi:hypothetical protein [Nesterenkonia halotolerans]|uniref:PknH-like extracellular domain-containing protein n=1 Tax=Nesterenkonia halotolerans TaxID=225325 RepID=A0ABR9J6P6_9MICC|nr:hypothetical protein [Nesterenkonia halotolerans]MBE1514671.1 hypothetical protein [Nesterenkonia halotolerans]